MTYFKKMFDSFIVFFCFPSKNTASPRTVSSHFFGYSVVNTSDQSQNECFAYAGLQDEILLLACGAGSLRSRNMKC